MGYLGNDPNRQALTTEDIADGTITNADINASAAIAYSKLAALSDGNILVGNGSNVAVSVNPSGDVDVSNAGVFSIASGVIVNDDINASAAIAMSKTALTAGTGLTLTTNSLAVDASQTQITAVGTITTGVWNGTAVASGYIADAFLKNDASDTTTGTITAAGFTVGSMVLTDGVITDSSGVSVAAAVDLGANTLTTTGLVTAGSISTGGSILIDSTPADTVYSGITASFTAGEALEVGEVVYLKAADSRVWKAVSVVSGTGLISAEIMCMGMVAVAQASAGSQVIVLLQGFLQHQNNFPTYAVGETLYVPEAEVGGFNVPEGVSPDTDGDFIQVIGWAAGADTVYFNPDFTIIEHA